MWEAAHAALPAAVAQPAEKKVRMKAELGQPGQTCRFYRLVVFFGQASVHTHSLYIVLRLTCILLWA
jgi:hypothetical protein